MTAVSAAMIAALTGAVPPSFTFGGFAADEADQTTYSGFTGKSIGAANATRRVLVGVGASNAATRSLSSLTVQGISATLLAGTEATIFGTTFQFAIADVPTGTTADIVPTFDGVMQRCNIIWWSLYDLASSTPKQSTASSADPATLSLNLDAGDLFFCAGFNNNNTSASPTGYTEDADSNATARTITGGHFVATAAESPHAASMNWADATGGFMAASSCSFA